MATRDNYTDSPPPPLSTLRRRKRVSEQYWTMTRAMIALVLPLLFCLSLGLFAGYHVIKHAVSNGIEHRINKTFTGDYYNGR